MRETEFKPKLIKLHYFSVTDERFAKECGMKQDKKGAWYLPEYNVSSKKFNLNFGDLYRGFGTPRTYILGKKE